VEQARVTVHKPNAPIPYEFTDVSVTVEAKRND
jgi:dihydroneopterin aldolase